MFAKLLALLTDCRALVAQVTALRAEVNDLKAKLADCEKGRADAEAVAQALKDELEAALSGFTPSGN